MEKNSNDQNDLLVAAREHFKEGRHNLAETLLNQLILKSYKHPEIFHMLGTIYYDQGKFNKAIRSFRRALEIDPAFTDASIGLSIILNDLGRYDEGKKVFDEAKVMLERRSADGDPYVNEKLAIKHDEIGELYCQYKRYNEALEQYFKSLQLSTRRPEITMKIVDCYSQLGQYEKAIKHLKDLCREFPAFLPARIQLGKVFYTAHRVPEAVNEWEEVLRRDPSQPLAREYLKTAQSAETTSLDQSL